MAGGVIATTKFSSSLSSSLSPSLATVFFIVLAAFVVAACRRAAVARDHHDQPFPHVDARRVAPTVLLTLSLDARRPCGRLFFDCCVLRIRNGSAVAFFLIVAFYASVKAATVATIAIVVIIVVVVSTIRL